MPVHRAPAGHCSARDSGGTASGEGSWVACAVFVQEHSPSGAVLFFLTVSVPLLSGSSPPALRVLGPDLPSGPGAAGWKPGEVRFSFVRARAFEGPLTGGHVRLPGGSTGACRAPAVYVPACALGM